MKNMWTIYHDEIPEFLKEFMELELMKRIKNVGMNCGCEYTQFELFRNLKPYTRYDHSVGCALIIWHFTKDRAQTLSGLFHDVSSPAFSHVIDFLHKDHVNQESTEEKTEEILDSCAQLKSLLDKYSLSISQISDYHMYPIADNDTPRLSSDRLEYTLSNLYNYGFCTFEEIREFYDDLMVGVNEENEAELCFRTSAIAEKFALCALKMSEIYVADADRLIMQLLADLIGWAVMQGILQESDLYVDESHVISRLMADETAGRMWKQFCSLNHVERGLNSSEEGLFRQVMAKKRWINPMNAARERMMDVSMEFKAKADVFLSQNFEEIIRTDMKIINL